MEMEYRSPYCSVREEEWEDFVSDKNPHYEQVKLSLRKNKVKKSQDESMIIWFTDSLTLTIWVGRGCKLNPQVPTLGK